MRKGVPDAAIEILPDISDQHAARGGRSIARHAADGKAYRYHCHFAGSYAASESVVDKIGWSTICA